MKKVEIHYATGGFIPGEEMRKRGIKPKFTVLCGRYFRRGGSDIMDSGYMGAQRVTCKKCKKILNDQDKREDKAKKIRAETDRKIAAL